jgi:transposase InsO family protein
MIKPAEIIGFKAAKEYRRKTTRTNELWASYCCHLRVTDWGWYYLETVMDDFSCFILSWDLKTDMSGGSLEDVVQALKEYPELKRNSWAAHVIASAPDHPSHDHFPTKKDYFRYLGEGSYKLDTRYITIDEDVLEE